jgi:serine/threonine protein kinase
MESGPDNFDTFFSPGGEPSSPTQKGASKDGGAPPPPPPEPRADPNFVDTRAERDAQDVGDSEWGSPTVGEPAAAKPSVPPQIAAVGERIVQLQIVTQEQWDAAVARAADAKDLRSILDALQGMPSHRRTRGESQIPALSEHQAKLILEGQAKRLRLGPYLILDRLGAGGMGEVFRGWNLDLDRIEAVKTITSDDVTGSTMGLARFDREARVLAQLAHPCITTIYSTGREDGVAYIAMQYIRGRTLVQVVKDAAEKGEDVPVQWAVDVIREVASALEHAHSCGVIHRDIKPNNIMITNDGEVRVLDMGIARLVDPSARNAPGLTRHVAGMGTPEVMPPEQWADASSVSPASDIYSLGCTFFYLLAGRMPFVGEDLHTLMTAHLTKPTPDIRQIRPDAPRPIADILQRMTAKEVADRFPNCTELIQAIDECTKSSSRETLPPPAVPWAWVGAAAVVAALVSGFGLYIGTRRDYSAEAERWLVDWQKVTSEQWKSPDELRAAVAKSPYAAVDSADSLVRLQDWVKQATAERKREGDFNDFLVDFRRQHSSVWPNAAALNEFVEPLRGSMGYDAIRKRVREETLQREALRDQAARQVAEAFAASPEVWDSVEEVAAVADSAVPLDSVLREEHLGRRDLAIRTCASERWTKLAVKALEERQAAAGDVWKSPIAIIGWSKDQVPFESITTSKDYHRLLDLVQRETLNRKSHQWVLQYLAEHPLAWKGDDELVAFVRGKFPDGVESEAAFAAMQSEVRRETMDRMRRMIKQWAGSYVEEHPDVWPETDALVDAVYSAPNWEALARQASREDFTKKADAATYRRVFQTPLRPTGDKLKDYHRLEMMRLIDFFLGLANSAVQPTVRVELAAEINGRPVRNVPLEQEAVVTVTSSVRGYVTLIVLGSRGEVFMIQWDEPIPPGRRMSLIPLSAESDGVERLVAYVTDQSPWRILPKPPADLGVSAKRVPLEGNYLQQMVDPAIRLFSDEDSAKDDFEPIHKALSSRRLLQNLLDMLFQGVAPGYLPATTSVKQWGRAAIEIQSGDP